MAGKFALQENPIAKAVFSIRFALAHSLLAKRSFYTLGCFLEILGLD